MSVLYVFMYTYVCMYVCLYVYVCMYTHIHVFVCVCVCLYSCMCVCMYADMRSFVMFFSTGTANSRGTPFLDAFPPLKPDNAPAHVRVHGCM